MADKLLVVCVNHCLVHRQESCAGSYDFSLVGKIRGQFEEWVMRRLYDTKRFLLHDRFSIHTLFG
jgi:hypothetical protein